MGRATCTSPLSNDRPEDLLKPDRKHFYIDYLGSIGSRFNRAVIDIVVEEVFRLPSGLDIKDRPFVMTATKTHVMHLQRQYRSSLSREQLSCRLKRLRVTARKRQVRNGMATRTSGPTFTHDSCSGSPDGSTSCLTRDFRNCACTCRYFKPSVLRE